MSLISTSSTSGADNLLASAIGTAKAAASSTSSASTSTGGESSNSTALASLGSNYNEFLTLLTAQLKNQDPSSPMDTNSFTSELAQFAGVEQQVQTNTNLTSLISLTQDGAAASARNLIGKTVSVSGSSLPLQNGSASVSFDAPQAGAAAIAVTNAAGQVVKTQELSVATGNNAWTWDGKNDDGVQMQDGAYSIGIDEETPSGTAQALPTTATGVVTGVTGSGANVNLKLGEVTTGLNNLSGT